MQGGSWVDSLQVPAKVYCGCQEILCELRGHGYATKYRHKKHGLVYRCGDGWLMRFGVNNTREEFDVNKQDWVPCRREYDE